MSVHSHDRNLLRITVDTNLIVSGLIRIGTPPNQLLRAWTSRAFQLATSNEIRAEVADVLHRPKFDRYNLDTQLIADVLEALAASELVAPLANLALHCRDPKDDMVLACALAGQLDYIVTGDKDLHDLAGHPALGSIRIVTVREFLTILRSEPE